MDTSDPVPAQVPPETQPKKRVAPIGTGDESQTTLANTIQGTYIEEGLDDKQYIIKSSGTIIDVSKKRKKKHRKIPMSVRKPTSDQVCLLSSQFKSREPTLFFPYPAYVGSRKKTEDRVTVQESRELESRAPRFKIAETTNIYNAIVNSCKNAGLALCDEFEMCARKKYNEGRMTLEELTEILGKNVEEETEDDRKEENIGKKDFNLIFTGAVKEEVLKQLRPNQKINHFPFSYNIGRKDAMWKNYKRLEDEFPEDYDFCPVTYIFPQD